MRLIKTFVITAAIMTMTGSLAFAQPPQYLGPSNDAGAPNTGVLGFNALCKATYGDGAQFCSSQDILRSGSLPAEPQLPMWVMPTIVESVVDPNQGVVVFDASGVAAPLTIGGGIFSALNCGGWRVMGGGVDGLAVGAQGSFQRISCDTDRRAACCKVNGK